MKKNKVIRIALMGGLLGMLLTNPRNALQKSMDAHNNEGWYAKEIVPHSTSNLFVLILQVVVLILTIGLFTFGAGYLILFERED